jgi:hypothetical protein
MAETPYLVDSNIVLRWIKSDHSDYPTMVSADARKTSNGALLQLSNVF